MIYIFPLNNEDEKPVSTSVSVTLKENYSGGDSVMGVLNNYFKRKKPRALLETTCSNGCGDVKCFEGAKRRYRINCTTRAHLLVLGVDMSRPDWEIFVKEAVAEYKAHFAGRGKLRVALVIRRVQGTGFWQPLKVFDELAAQRHFRGTGIDYALMFRDSIEYDPAQLIDWIEKNGAVA